MNERIRELAKQAAKSYHQTMDFSTHCTLPVHKVQELATQSKDAGIEIISDEFCKKFAQLIVQECIDELDGKIYRAIDHEGDETWPDLILKEHFGVEE